MNKLSDSWKVPGRQVYCETFGVWLKTCFYCHVWLRIRPTPALPKIG